MEARGQVRGGRFVKGFSGEQFAQREAVGLLREINRRTTEGELVAISAADPLNLIGAIVPGTRVPALTSNRILYRDGIPIATLTGKEMHRLTEMDSSAEWQARTALLRRRMTVFASGDRGSDADLPSA
jgi:ATP-dependent Lhr-like helicase